MWSFFKRRRRNRLIKTPLSDSDRRHLMNNIKGYTRMTDYLKQQFEACVKVMVGERQWEGCNGLEMTDEVRLTIAGNASLMLLGTSDYYFHSVTSILVYPNVIERSEDGMTSQLVGEAWQGGGVILSWPQVLSDSRSDHGQNVVIHEFAHHLDGLDGEMGGSIPFARRADQVRWNEVAQREFERLASAADRDRPTLLDPYGAESMAEFFAVVSECFFEQPFALEQEHRELFDLLCTFYHLNPQDWQSAH